MRNQHESSHSLVSSTLGFFRGPLLLSFGFSYTIFKGVSEALGLLLGQAEVLEQLLDLGVLHQFCEFDLLILRRQPLEVRFQLLYLFLQELQFGVSLRVLKVVNVKTGVSHEFFIDPRREARAHDLLDHVELTMALVLEHLEVLLSVEVLPRKRHNQVSILVEVRLLVAEEI